MPAKQCPPCCARKNNFDGIQLAGAYQNGTTQPPGLTSIRVHASTRRWDGEESPQVMTRHDASWCVAMRHGAARRFAEGHRSRVTTCHDASRCVTARHDASASRCFTKCHHASRRVMVCHDVSQVGHNASRRLTTRRDAAPSRRVSTRHGVTSRRVMVCHTMRHDASRRVAMRHRRDVSRREKVSPRVTRV